MPNESLPRLQIIIVNYRVGRLVADCLHSLESELQSTVRWTVTIVDNHSQDDSVSTIETTIQGLPWRDRVRLMPLESNDGFSAGNNAAIRSSLAEGNVPDFFLLLNPDTLVRPGALAAMTDFALARPQVGIVGGRLEYKDGTPQGSVFPFPSLLGEFFAGSHWLPVLPRKMRRKLSSPPTPTSPLKSTWVSGACFLMRSEMVRSLGLMDEKYFLYHEETDYCRRAREAGWECWHVPAARIVHFRGQSTGLDLKNGELRPRPKHWFDSRRYYFIKHHGVFYCALADLAWILGNAVYFFGKRFKKRSQPRPPHFFSDFVRNSVFMKGAS